MKVMERMGGRVDRDAGLIRGVKLLGRKSRNGRTYTERAMENAAPNYNGKKVYLDHPEREAMAADRKFKYWVGVVENAKFRGDIYGDIRLRKHSEHFEALIEAAESFDGFFGMSHVADGESHYADGEEIIEAIREVFSVDIVTQPATTAGLFESGPMEFDSPLLHDGPLLPDVDPSDFEPDPEQPAADYLKPVRNLLAKHGGMIAQFAGQSAFDSLAALVGDESAEADEADEAEPVQESFRRSTQRPEDFAPLIPRQYSHDEQARFAQRLR